MDNKLFKCKDSIFFERVTRKFKKQSVVEIYANEQHMMSFSIKI